MDINQMYPSKFLHGRDLAGPVTVTIRVVKAEEIYTPGKGKTPAFVLYCEKASKAIVMRKNLAGQIAAALQETDTDNWPGRQIVLYPELVQVGREQVTAIRAKAVSEQVTT